jgi:hypothetical protein
LHPTHQQPPYNTYHNSSHNSTTRSFSNTPLPKGVPSASFHLTKKIMSCGEDWSSILTIYTSCKEAGDIFDHVNYATALLKLGGVVSKKTRREIMDQPDFADLVRDMHKEMLDSSELKHFGGVASVTTILQGLGRLLPLSDVQSPVGSEVFEILDAVENNATWFMAFATWSQITNVVRAFDAFEYPAPNLFAMIDDRTDDLMENTTTSEKMDISSAFTNLKIPAPRLHEKIVVCED